jgi:hypothetical protein
MESIFETREEYFAFVKAWKTTYNSEDRSQLTFQHYLLYRLFKGKDPEACIAKTSSQFTKQRAKHWLEKCKPENLSLWPFGGSITPEMATKARVIMGYI